MSGVLDASVTRSLERAPDVDNAAGSEPEPIDAQLVVAVHDDRAYFFHLSTLPEQRDAAQALFDDFLESIEFRVAHSPDGRAFADYADLSQPLGGRSWSGRHQTCRRAPPRHPPLRT